MKKLLLFLVIGCMIFSLSCQSIDSIANDMFLSMLPNKTKQYDALYTLGSYIPGVLISDIRDGNVDIIEEDDYGRVLFEIGSDFHIISNYRVFAILQKNDRKSLWFYYDVFYCYFDNIGEIDSNSMTDFKSTNDWGQPLVESKLSCRSICVNSNFLIDKPAILSDSFKENIFDDLSTLSPPIESSPSGLFLLDPYSTDGAVYQLVCTSKSNQIELYILTIDEETVVSFKRVL